MTSSIKSYTIIDSPIGPLTLVARGGAILAVYTDNQRHQPKDDFGQKTGKGFEAVTEQLDAYFAGTLREFDLSLQPHGTEFQKKVWMQLRQIPYGETWSYGELAERIGNPKAARAVGLANGRNPISIIVPCHRVIGADGSLTGYGGGLNRKQELLDLEQRIIAPTLFLFLIHLTESPVP